MGFYDFLKNHMDRKGLLRMAVALVVCLIIALSWYLVDGSTECLWATAVVAAAWTVVLLVLWMNHNRRSQP